MNAFKTCLMLAALACAPHALLAQAAPQPAAQPAQSSAQSEAGEPRASTSPDAAPQNPPAETSAASAPASPPAPASTRPARPSKAPAAAGAPAPAAGAKPAGNDRLELGTATVTGDREQPKVMYIVPWKRSDIGDLSGKPMNSLLDEALAPIDREEFKRQVMYYQAVKSDAAQNGASKTPAQGEK
jgi:hypothetical protein